MTADRYQTISREEASEHTETFQCGYRLAVDAILADLDELTKQAIGQPNVVRAMTTLTDRIRAKFKPGS